MPYQPSTAGTLAALAEVMTSALAPLGVTVRTDPGTLPPSDPGPLLIITEKYDVLVDTFTQEKGNPADEPNTYKLTYLQERVSTTGTPVTTAIVALRAAVQAMKQPWVGTAYQTNISLPDPVTGEPRVLAAGQVVRFPYDDAGPFLTYFGQAWVGVQGTITVLERFQPMM